MAAFAQLIGGFFLANWSVDASQADGIGPWDSDGSVTDDPWDTVLEELKCLMQIAGWRIESVWQEQNQEDAWIWLLAAKI